MAWAIEIYCGLLLALSVIKALDLGIGSGDQISGEKCLVRFKEPKGRTFALTGCDRAPAG